MNDLASICTAPETPIHEVLRIIDAAPGQGLPGGIALVIGSDGGLAGTITEGDIRRAILEWGDLRIEAERCMQPDPIVFPDSVTILEILDSLPEELARRGRRSKKYLGKIVLVDERRRPTRVLDYHELWEQRMAMHRHVVIVGLGYVGLTLGLALADTGFLVTGYDTDDRKVDQLSRGESYIHELGLPELLRKHVGRHFHATTEIPDNGDVYVISVGTPVGHEPESGKARPIMSYLDAAVRSIAGCLHRGNLVVLRSTVPVGTSRSFVIPRIEELTGFRCGIDYHLSFAPERTAEGKAIRELRELPQLIGGFNQDSVEATAALFRELTHTIVRVESLEGAELAKLINNCFRDLSFAFANQITQIASHFDMDIVDVITAANQGYPRNRVPMPSPGVGGPCLTKDPYILASVADELGFPSTLFEGGRAVNESMHAAVCERVLHQLRHVGKDPKDCRVLVCGLAFKGNPETADLRDSTSLNIVECLRPHVGSLFGHDPVAPDDEIREHDIVPVDLPEGFQGMDAVLFLNNHQSFEKLDVAAMMQALNPYPVVFDGWKAFQPDDVLDAAPSVYMGLSISRSSIQGGGAVSDADALMLDGRGDNTLVEAS